MGSNRDQCLLYMNKASGFHMGGKSSEADVLHSQIILVEQCSGKLYDFRSNSGDWPSIG